jgi:type III restriction enzyme
VATQLGPEAAHTLHRHLQSHGFIDAAGEVQDTLRTALREGTFHLPEAHATHLSQVQEALRRIAGRVDIRNAAQPATVSASQGPTAGFEALWERIRQRTACRVRFDGTQLIHDCVKAIARSPSVPGTRVMIRRADLAIGQGGVRAMGARQVEEVVVDEVEYQLPDILTELEHRTHLTRRSLAVILRESGRLADFKRNPQAFIERADEIINRARCLVLGDGIKYRRRRDELLYVQSLFERDELIGHLRQLLGEEQASLLGRLLDNPGGIEPTVADQLGKDDVLKVYPRLPDGFQVTTPLGMHRPMWAVLLANEGQEQLYLPARGLRM